MPPGLKWNSQPTSGLQCYFCPIAGSVPACCCNSCTSACTDNKRYNSKSRMVYRPIYIHIFHPKKKPNNQNSDNRCQPPAQLQSIFFFEMSQESSSIRWSLDLQEDLGELRKVVFGCFKYTWRVVWFCFGFRPSFSFFW